MIKQSSRLGRIMQVKSWRYDCYELHTSNTVKVTHFTKGPPFYVSVTETKGKTFQNKYFI